MIEGPLLIDTHVWLWMDNGSPGRISASALREIEEADRYSRLRISAMSAWEVAMLDSKQRITPLPDVLSWIRQSLSFSGRTLLPITHEIAVVSTRLPKPSVADPVDLILLATACVEGATLMTADRKLLHYGKQHQIRVISA